MLDFKTKLIGSTLLAAFIAGTAFAQEATTEAPADAATETPAETTTDAPADAAADAPAEGTSPTLPDRSLGEDVVDPNAPGTIYVKEAKGDWQIRCIRTEIGADPCQIFQGLQDDQGTTVAEITMVALANAGDAVAGATVTTPLGTLLTEQVVIAVDGGAGKRYPFTWCDPEGCHARLGFNADGLASMKRGASAKVTVTPLLTPDQPVILTMSLTGFTAAFDTMSTLNDEAAAKAAEAAPTAETPAEGSE